MLKIGLTGGIASGKSAVADTLGELGATVIDTDRIARDIVEPGTPGLAQVLAEFGPDVLAADGSLDRAVVRALVFSNRERREQLERILHPLIRAATLEAAAAATGPYLVIVVPLLVETDFSELVDRVLVVDCDPALQIERVMQRDNATGDEARRIIRSQTDRSTRLEAADDVLDNSGTLDDLHAATAALHAQYMQLAGR